MLRTISSSRVHTYASALLAAGMAASVGTALAFEHIGGYLPCELCLEQRIPYYIGAPIMVLALLSSLLRMPSLVTRLLLLAGGLLMLWGFVLAGYHAGVEWSWWEGPADCASPIVSSTGGSLLDQLNAIIPPSCSEASWRLAGLSFAGWNFIASAIWAIIALTAAARK